MSRWFPTQSPEHYRGLTVHAAPGLHEAVVGTIVDFVPSGSRILDVGAGAGALSMRLADRGYQLLAIDVDASEWVSADIPFQKLDINQGLRLPEAPAFAAVCCIEVVEHIENPWALLRDLYALVAPGGQLIVSTPNIANFWSRAKFLLTGRFLGFDVQNLSYGHINPISAFEMRTIGERTGWELVDVRPAGRLPACWSPPREFWKWPVQAAIAAIATGVRLLSGGEENRGHCLVFVFRRPVANGAGLESLSQAG